MKKLTYKRKSSLKSRMDTYSSTPERHMKNKIGNNLSNQVIYKKGMGMNIIGGINFDRGSINMETQDRVANKTLKGGTGFQGKQNRQGEFRYNSTLETREHSPQKANISVDNSLVAYTSIEFKYIRKGEGQSSHTKIMRLGNTENRKVYIYIYIL